MIRNSKITLQHAKLYFIPVFSLVFLILLGFNMGHLSLAQELAALSKERQEEIVKVICEKLVKLFPDPEIAKITSVGINENFETGKYSIYSSASEFVQHLNDDLELISGDGHLGIIFDPAMASELKKNREVEQEGNTYAELTSESERWKNFGFKELKILGGNVGYLDLQTFFSLKYAGETAVASMSFFSNCNALIIDLRRNGGGWDDMVTFLASYFLNADEDIIFSITRSTLDDSYFASMPHTYVPGKKLTNIPICILISRSTASAAEAVANIMKHFSKNTTLVGETTAGAENPVEHLLLFDDYILRIPCWQKIYSYDKTGFEGIGIKPDIKVESKEALSVAHINLLLKLKEESTDEVIIKKYQWAIDGLSAVNSPVEVPENILRSYAGNYGNREIYCENNNLYYQYKGRTKRKMFAISNEYFLVEGYDFFRVKFVSANNTVVSIDEIQDDGTATTLQKE